MLLVVFLRKGFYIESIDDLSDKAIIDKIKGKLDVDEFSVGIGAPEAKLATYYKINGCDGDEDPIGEFIIVEGSIFLDRKDLNIWR